MQIVDINGNMFGYDFLEVIGINGKPKVLINSTTWGSITGTLSDQTDLQSALNAKLNNPTGTSSQYIDGTGALQTFPTLTSADKMVTVGRNSTGSTLYKGTVIYILGSTGNRPNYVKAQANAEATSAGTFGVVLADIPNNSDGQAVTIGTIDSLDTRSVATHPFTTDTLADGDTIYLSPTIAGYVTNVKPKAPNHLVYVGKVVRTSPTNGTIVYRIQNGYELDEIHDVQILTTPSNGQVLTYESSSSLWKPKNIPLVASTYICDIGLSTNQSIPSAIDTLVSFIDISDVNNWYDPTSKRFSPNIAGYYHIDFCVWFNAALLSTSQYNIQIRKNGTTEFIAQQPTVNSTTGQTLNGSKLMYFNGTSDYIDFTVYQGTGSNKDIIKGTSNSGTYATIFLLAM